MIAIVDENNELTGEVKTYKEIHEKGLWHRTAVVWVVNNNSEVLLQKRGPNVGFPNLLDCSVGGHYPDYENSFQAAIREAKEELGIELKKEDLDEPIIVKSQMTNDWRIENEFISLFFVKLDIEKSDLKLQEEEVSEVIFMNIDEFIKDKFENPENHVNHTGGYDEIVFEKLKEISRK